MLSTHCLKGITSSVATIPSVTVYSVTPVLRFEFPVSGGTIRELIPSLLYIQNLQLSSHEFKYPPSCFNVLMTPLKM